MVYLEEKDLTRKKTEKLKSSLNNEDFKVRVRRTQSVTKAENLVAVDRKVRRLQTDKPCHLTRDSLFSWSSNFNDFGGFVNWGGFMLFMGGVRLFLENVLKYGIRISPPNVGYWLMQENQNDYYYHTPLFLLVSNLHFLWSFTLEKLLSKGVISSKVGVWLHVSHIITIIFTPIVLFTFWGNSFSLLGRTVISIMYILAFMKLWSYAHVNHWCRIQFEKAKRQYRIRSYSFKTPASFEPIQGSDHDSSDEGNPSNAVDPAIESYCPVEYPNNLTLRDLYYFLAAPTLCYELNFPRSPNIRTRFLLRRLMEVFVISNILIGLFQQWIIPSVKNSLKPFSEMDYAKSTERVLKLAIPNHLLWLVWFYLMFHSFLNTVGELLRFGDRNFYQDWWNAKDVGTFWRQWNLPVHNWCVRHVFVPILKMKYSKFTASLAVFALSAFLHEYSVSVPLGMYKIGVFWGMWMQVPLVYFSSLVSKRFGHQFGNIMVWSSIIMGQPIAIMIYVHDYIIQNHGSILIDNGT